MSATEDAAGPRPVARALAALRTAAGPVAIAAVVLGLLNGFLAGRLSTQHPDLVQQWLPAHCFLGKSLASGHVPAWNPSAAGGVPWAADPQSGWMYLPAMALYSALPCNVALGWFVALQPVLAGLGLYWFLRIERVSRPAASAGGLFLALLLAGSRMAIELPFSGALAWTALLLACTARYLRSGGWPGRIGWGAAAAACWGQIALAHLSHGLVIGTLAFAVYLGVRLVADVSNGTRPPGEALAAAALLFALLPLVNLAVLLPRLAYLPRTTLGLGYDGMNAVQAHLLGRSPPPPIRASAGSLATQAIWPLDMMTSPGPYLGVVASTLSLAAPWARRHRPLVLAFFAVALVCWLASLQGVAHALGPALAHVPFADFYQHAPVRFAFGTRLAVAVLVGLGVQAWIGATSLRSRVVMLVPGPLVWWGLAAATGRMHPGRYLFVVGLVLAAVALVASARRPALAALLPAVLLVELTANAAWGQVAPEPAAHSSLHVRLLPPKLPGPAYLRPTGTERALLRHPDERYVSLVRPGLSVGARTVLAVLPKNWAAAADQRAMLFGLEDVDVYNPTQLLRFWTFVRAVQPVPLKYNVSYLVDPSRTAFDVLGVDWVVEKARRRPAVPGSALVARDGPWSLFRLPNAVPRASLFVSWDRAGTESDALDRVRAPGFDPTASLVVEGGPAPPGTGAPGGSGPADGGGSATYRSLGPQAARVDVLAPRAAMLLVRTPFDPNWHATVDGRPVPVLPADSVVQAVPVLAGRHVVALAYDDPSVGYGLLGTGLVLAALLGAGVALRRRRPAPTLATS